MLPQTISNHSRTLPQCTPHSPYTYLHQNRRASRLIRPIGGMASSVLDEEEAAAAPASTEAAGVADDHQRAGVADEEGRATAPAAAPPAAEVEGEDEGAARERLKADIKVHNVNVSFTRCVRLFFFFV